MRIVRLVAALAIASAAAWAADEAGFQTLFDGKTLDGWKLVGGHGPGYVVEDGLLVCPADGGGNLFTQKEYSNFVFRFEFRMTDGANNGIGIRAPFEGDAAYQGMEIQILDNAKGQWGVLRSEQAHGSVYDVIPARTGFLKQPGEWNTEEITANGRRVKVVLNGVIILDANLDMVREPAVLKKHAATFKPLKQFTVAKYFGSLTEAQKVHFNDGGQFDKLYTVR